MIVLPHKVGRLGNRLLMSGHLIAFSRDQGVPFVNTAFDEYAHLFEGTRADLFCRYPPPGTPLRAEWARPAVWRVLDVFARLVRRLHLGSRFARVIYHRETSIFDIFDLSSAAGIDAMRSALVVFVCGWQFITRSGFARHADAIREYFTPIASIRDAVARTVNAAREGADILVGVHVRRTDFAHTQGNQWFFPFETYTRAMQHFAEQFPSRHVRFLVCSDEELSPASFPGLSVHLARGSAIEDMYSLAGCDYIFGPPSTFSGWASYYGGVPLGVLDHPKRVLRPSDCFVSWIEDQPVLPDLGPR